MKTELSHKERIDRFLDGLEIDRPAVSAWRHYYHRENSRHDLVASMIDFQNRFDWDFIKINPRASYHVEDWGVKMQFSNDPHIKPRILNTPVGKKHDWIGIKPLDPTSGVLGEILGATRDIVNQASPEIHIFQTVFSPLSIAGDLVESDPRFVGLLHEGPEELHDALESITETYSAFVKELLKTGITGIFFATTEWASRDLITENEYLEFGRPYDMKILKTAGPAKVNIIHVCGRNNMLPIFRDYPASILSWNPYDDGNLSVHQAAQITDKYFLTGIDHLKTLLSGTEDEVRAQIMASLREAPGGRLIIGPGCAAKAATPDENLKAIHNTAREWTNER